jgi:two-component system sensor histidine kinase PilS (NtrC family)
MPLPDRRLEDSRSGAVLPSSLATTQAPGFEGGTEEPFARATTWRETLGVADEAAQGVELSVGGLDPSSRRRAAEPEEQAHTGLFRQLRRVVAAGDSAQRRLFITYVTARAALGVALLLMQVVQIVVGARGLLALPALICLGYAAQAVLCWVWPSYRSPEAGRISLRQWWMTVGVDVLVFSLLHWLDAYSTLNFAALLVLPVLMAGVLCTWVPALATTSAVTLMVLAVAMDRAAQGGDAAALLMQAGLAGAGLFIITLVAGQLASWAANEERTALDSLELAHQQAELNRLVIDEMAEGVLVVDRDGLVRVANPAACALLAEDDACPATPFSLLQQPGWRSMWLTIERAFITGHWPPAGTDLAVSYEDQVPRAIRMRVRCTRGLVAVSDQGLEGEVLAVVFLEESRSVEARQRQERLMAMGRISASIAHEIRNPLAAVSQANALLMEDAERPDQRLLGRIVADNVERLKRIVEDVMEAAPAGSVASSVIEIGVETQIICQEWARTVGLPTGPDSRLSVLPAGQPLGAFFDDHHLHRVLVNLLDNALRHSDPEPGAVRVSVESLDEGFVRLSVASQGELIAPEVESHLFEPFHSTRSRGTGLGLYICRELCQRHGAIIDYVRRPGERHGNVFIVVMRRAHWPMAFTFPPQETG